MAQQVWKFEPTHRWVRTEVNGEVVADSKNAMLMIESPGELDYYFPVGDINMAYLQASDHEETSGYRGVRKFWHVNVNGKLVENAAWTYETKDNRPDFTDYIAFKWSELDAWYEEAEEVFLHPRNPYHRVDTISSNRHVQVIVDGVVVADTVKPNLLFETSMPTRYYIPEEDVNQEFLTSTATQTVCPYKGWASYYTVDVKNDALTDAVWYYPEPIVEASKLKGTIAFWPEKDKSRIQILVDGEPA